MTAKIVDIRKSYVDGRFVTGEGSPLAVENPATEETIAEAETLSLAQMEEAVLAARRAFDDGAWSGLRARGAGREGARASASTSPVVPTSSARRSSPRRARRRRC